jgi:hypothetical protein
MKSRTRRHAHNHKLPNPVPGRGRSSVSGGEAPLKSRALRTALHSELTPLTPVRSFNRVQYRYPAPAAIHFEYERAPGARTGDLGHWRYFAEISGFARSIN